ncbi:MAG: hypothetical protein ACYCQJ_11290 [Nitrososphaerales archaeon]
MLSNEGTGAGRVIIKGEREHLGEIAALLWQIDIDPPPFKSFEK